MGDPEASKSTMEEPGKAFPIALTALPSPFTSCTRAAGQLHQEDEPSKHNWDRVLGPGPSYYNYYNYNKETPKNRIGNYLRPPPRLPGYPQRTSLATAAAVDLCWILQRSRPASIGIWIVLLFFDSDGPPLGCFQGAVCQKARIGGTQAACKLWQRQNTHDNAI